MPKVSAGQSNQPEKVPEKKPQVKTAPATPSKPAQAPKATSWVHAPPSTGPARPKKADGFQSINPDARKPSAPPRTSEPAAPASGLGKLLQEAQEAGKYFKARKRGGGGGGQAAVAETELASAVEEARRLLHDVKGIGEIGPGENDAGEPVVLISAGRGFTDVSMRAIPWHVGRFATLVALPYEVLPLRQG